MEFGPDSKSIWFGEAHGRLGNQLFGYSILQHFRHRLGVDAFINEECRQYLLKVGRISLSHYWPSGVIRIGLPV